MILRGHQKTVLFEMKKGQLVKVTIFSMLDGDFSYVGLKFTNSSVTFFANNSKGL